MAFQSHMRRKLSLLMIVALVCLVVVGVAGGASRQAAKPKAASSHGLVRPDDLKWEPFIAPMQAALLSGDQAAAGPFVLPVKMPAGSTVQPHRRLVEKNLAVPGESSRPAGATYLTPAN
jgi:hypothetical protein